jgi:2-iminoacetate synthase ThiH
MSHTIRAYNKGFKYYPWFYTPYGEICAGHCPFCKLQWRKKEAARKRRQARDFELEIQNLELD